MITVEADDIIAPPTLLLSLRLAENGKSYASKSPTLTMASGPPKDKLGGPNITVWADDMLAHGTNKPITSIYRS